MRINVLRIYRVLVAENVKRYRSWRKERLRYDRTKFRFNIRAYVSLYIVDFDAFAHRC